MHICNLLTGNLVERVKMFILVENLAFVMHGDGINQN